MYFYFMNDYRSTFHGVNDHEADWEQVFVYLEDRPEGPRPVWIAAAAHDYIGDQLRRRWDDPTLVLDGDHPVVFAGGGSHATYFEQGEYMTSAPITALRGVTGLLEAGRAFWVNSLRQPDPGDLAAKLEATFSASFVDYARGDGTTVGPGELASGRRCSSRTTIRGSTVTAGCSASTHTTGSGASGRRRGRSTAAPASSA